MVTEKNPGPGRDGVGVKTGVAVWPSMIMGGRAKGVNVGWLGAWVGIFTMVAEGVGLGVRDCVGVSMGVNVIKGVEVGCGVRVDGRRSFIEQACKRKAKATRIFRMRIRCLMRESYYEIEVFQFHK